MRALETLFHRLACGGLVLASAAMAAGCGPSDRELRERAEQQQRAEAKRELRASVAAFGEEYAPEVQAQVAAAEAEVAQLDVRLQEYATTLEAANVDPRRDPNLAAMQRQLEAARARYNQLSEALTRVYLQREARRLGGGSQSESEKAQDDARHNAALRELNDLAVTIGGKPLDPPATKPKAKRRRKAAHAEASRRKVSAPPQPPSSPKSSVASESKAHEADNGAAEVTPSAAPTNRTATAPTTAPARTPVRAGFVAAPAPGSRENRTVQPARPGFVAAPPP